MTGLAIRSPRRIASAMLVPPGSLRRHANVEKGAPKTRSNRHSLSNARMSDRSGSGSAHPPPGRLFGWLLALLIKTVSSRCCHARTVSASPISVLSSAEEKISQ